MKHFFYCTAVFLIHSGEERAGVYMTAVGWVREGRIYGKETHVSGEGLGQRGSGWDDETSPLKEEVGGEPYPQGL